MLRKDVDYSAFGKEGRHLGESDKSRDRRIRENWFEKYAPEHLSGIDIGCGVDPLHESYFKWDSIYGDGDATYMDGIPDESFHVVYSSHLLEHLENPVEAVTNWWRILKPGGYLIIVVPHRDLYEQKKELPSRWNGDHKSFWLPDKSEPPHTLSLAHVICQATGRDTVLIRVLDEGYSYRGVDNQAGGEYSIEALLRK